MTQRTLLTPANAVERSLNTYEQVAEFLIKNDGYYIRNDWTLHVLIRPKGDVRFWENYKGYESPLYASVEILFKKCQIDLPLKVLA